MNAIAYAFVAGLHILVCVILVIVVLLQTGKGADIGAAFGGSSQTVFGSRGPTTFFHYLTTGSAVLFMFTSIFLSCSPAPKTGGKSLVTDDPDTGALTTGSAGTMM